MKIYKFDEYKLHNIAQHHNLILTDCHFYVARYVDIEGKYDYATVLSRFNEGRTFTA